MQEDSDPPDNHTVVAPGLGRKAAREEIGHYLIVVGDGAADRRIELSSAPLSIGRDASRDLVLNDVNVSRLHAEVSLVNGQVFVTDRGSTNGTFINGRRVSARGRMMDGDVLHVGGARVRYERRTRREVQEALSLNRDLEKATSYVLSLFPAPIADGPVRTDWFFRPSARLGGDGFGYEWLNSDLFALYIIDVSGHGLGAAMHTVSVLNVLRQRALPLTDFTEPTQVLSALNGMFQMDSHDGMYFTMWYGVFDRTTRNLRYASAGHHPVFCASPEGRLLPLKTPGMMIGATSAPRFHADEVTIGDENRLYLFSDGVFEISTATGEQWRLRDFVTFLEQPPQVGVSEPHRLYEAVSGVCGPSGLEDDFSLLVVTLT